jgi:hypothetical protein
MGEAALKFLSLPANAPEEGRVYEHHDGGMYRVLCVAQQREERESWVVVYISLEDGHRWASPLEVWMEPVQWTDGAVRSRFTAPLVRLPPLRGRAANDQSK